MTGIKSIGVYLPLLRLQRQAAVAANAWFDNSLKGLGKGSRTMCNWDEDSITMATEAVRAAFSDTPANTEVLFMASTSFPFQERQNAGVVAEALSIAPSVRTMDISGSLRAGTSALLAGLDAVAAGSTVLVVASEHRRAAAGGAREISYGDGAAALLLCRDDPALEVLGSRTHNDDFIDQYRGDNEPFEYGWEERWIRDEGYNKLVAKAVMPLLSACNVEAGEIAHFILPAPNQRVAEGVAKILGIRAEAVSEGLYGEVGHAGAAHPLLMLAGAVARAQPGDLILLTAFGQGCDALLLRATETVAETVAGLSLSQQIARGVEETNYHKFLAFNGTLIRDLGKRAEMDYQTSMSAFYRNRGLLTSFKAGKCDACGTEQIPQGPYCLNPHCVAPGPFAEVSLVHTPGTVKTWTADRLTFDFNPPAYFGMIEFDGGARLMMDFTDITHRTPAVGDHVSAHFRIKHFDQQRGFRRYFWKAITHAANGISGHE